MLCDICRDGLEGMWDAARTPRLALCDDWHESVNDEDDEIENENEKPLPIDDDQVEVEKYIYAHHPTKESFLQSMRQGCVMCNRFDPNQHHEPSPKFEGLGYFSVFYVCLSGQKKPVMCVEYGGSSGGFDLVPVGDPRYDSNMTMELGPSTDDPKTWDMINSWLGDCLENHTNCPGSVSLVKYLPTRLLSIDDAGDNKTFRLVLGSECPPNSQYMTLSHCWGTKPAELRLRLLKSTLEQLRAEQSIDALPKTFEDAMTIAKRFGIKYLWIDCLCIYQDSPEDWLAEASTMQDVYKNSFLNISALGAADDEGGCFVKRDPKGVSPTVVHLKRRDNEEPEPFRFELEKGWAWRLTFQSEPIVTRAWVVQERLLSPRVLHFGRKQVFWECRQLNACEIHPETVHCYGDDEDKEFTLPQEKHAHPWKQLLGGPDRRHVDDPYEQLFADWNAIIYIYTESNLTVPSDKLIALSGVANDMKCALDKLRTGPHRYLAGLWEERLREDLLWNADSGGKRLEKYRAPSWSWAAIDGKVRTSLIFAPEDCCVWFVDDVSGETEPIGEADTGEVKGGKVTVTGPWMQLEIGEAYQSYHHNIVAIEDFVHPDTGEKFQDEPDKLSTGQRLPPANVYFDTLEEMPREAFCMTFRAQLWAEEAYSYSSLVLVRAEGVEDGMYRRVGYSSSTIASRAKAVEFVSKFPRKTVTII
ncbi:HET-domain-containing protein [Lindgomyces ingoldianus]|uniref:HET-domain-containing protein n=1 Tax=Lindgomyces ingoldianus TaxID=673940 RepID=A0ACB6QFB5_9PLEO|nr:HET-domain-containing protein [Lindgomyces ingoldianus]KAF2465673.1 HET-domain-containing protein [Lindgomyces ingoldianus]